MNGPVAPRSVLLLLVLAATALAGCNDDPARAAAATTIDVLAVHPPQCFAGATTLVATLKVTPWGLPGHVVLGLENTTVELDVPAMEPDAGSTTAVVQLQVAPGCRLSPGQPMSYHASLEVVGPDGVVHARDDGTCQAHLDRVPGETSGNIYCV